MRYRDRLIEIAILYLNNQPDRDHDIHILLSNNHKYKDEKSEILRKCIDDIKALIKESA